MALGFWSTLESGFQSRWAKDSFSYLYTVGFNENSESNNIHHLTMNKPRDFSQHEGDRNHEL